MLEPGRSGVVLYVDLDDLKGINILGHSAGDRLIINDGEAIRRIVGETVFVARLAAHEFVPVLMEELFTAEISNGRPIGSGTLSGLSFWQ